MKRKEPFFGREKELSELREIIHSPGTTVVTITGIGGMGKTSLAVRLLDELKHEFRNGGVLVPLAELEHTGQLVPAILSALGRQSGESLGEKRLVDTLSRTEAFIVLDNFEHLITAAPLMESLSAKLTSSRIVITSRTSLGFAGEIIYNLSGMDLPEGDDWHETPSIMLFLSIYGTGAGKIGPEDLRLIGNICRSLAGVPLGIKLAASMCSERTIGEIHESISLKKKILDISGKTGERRHRSLRTVFNYSWMLLTAEERRVFTALSVFRGSFPSAAAKEVVAASEEVIQSLRRKSLLEMKKKASTTSIRFSVNSAPQNSLNCTVKKRCF